MAKSSDEAAVVCSHVAAGAVILQAVRDEPVEPADSGWQFLCDSGQAEDNDAAKVWAVSEVLEALVTLRRDSVIPELEKMGEAPGTSVIMKGKIKLAIEALKQADPKIYAPYYGG